MPIKDAITGARDAVADAIKPSKTDRAKKSANEAIDKVSNAAQELKK